MKRRDVPWIGGLFALGAWIWLRDLGWWSEASDTLPVLAALPLFLWLGDPWRFAPTPEKISPRLLPAGSALLLAGTLADLTLLLTAGWTILFWAWFRSRLAPANHPTAQRLLVLPMLAFPWIAYEGQAVGWWLRLSAAAAAQFLFACVGLNVARTGTDLVVQGSPVAIAPACAGLGTLQAMLIAGCVPAYFYLGERGGARYWAGILGLLAMGWLANTQRVVTIVVAAVSYGSEFAMGAFHQVGGWLVLVAMFALCCGSSPSSNDCRPHPRPSPPHETPTLRAGGDRVFASGRRAIC